MKKGLRSKFSFVALAFVACFFLQAVFAYSFGSSTFDGRFTSTLLSLGDEEKSAGNEITRFNIGDVSNPISYKEASSLLSGTYVYRKVFSHYMVAGENPQLGGTALQVFCEDLSLPIEALKVNGYNDLDYMYEMPLPLFLYCKDAEGNAINWPSYSERPMNISYGADYSTYISSSFADKLISSQPTLFQSYHDLIGRHYSIRFDNGRVKRQATCSINNIYMSSDSPGWSAEAKRVYEERFRGFPSSFGKIHEYGVFFLSNEPFLEYGFSYESDIFTTYSNYKFYLQDIAGELIRSRRFSVYAEVSPLNASNPKWDDYQNLSTLIWDPPDFNPILLLFSVLSSLLFLVTYVFAWILITKDLFVYRKWAGILALTPLILFAIIQISFACFQVYSRFLFYSLNNFVGNAWIVASLVICACVFLVAKSRDLDSLRVKLDADE